jgi:RNA polymerase sigma-70 factor (ECF subfamily)
LDRGERFEAEALPHFKALYGTAYRMTRSGADAQDLVQDTLLKAFRAFDSFQPGTNIRAWLFTILHRARMDQLRRLLRRRDTEELSEADAAVPAPQEAVAAGEDLRRALARLPEVFRTAVVLRDLEEFSYQEIAAIMGVPIGTVMSRIHRGRALLRQALVEARP